MDDAMHRRLARPIQPGRVSEDLTRQVAQDRTLLEEILEHPGLKASTRMLIESWQSLPDAGRPLTAAQRERAQEIQNELDRTGRR